MDNYSSARGRSYGNSSFNSYGRSSYQPSVQLPQVKFYEAGDTEKKLIRSDLLDKEADTCAKAFVEGKIKAAQLRKFYGAVKALELVWKSKGADDDSFRTILPQIKLMKAKASYAKGRKVVPDCFAAWLSSCADMISDTRDFEAFLLHFEAVVGFAYGEGLKD